MVVAADRESITCGDEECTNKVLTVQNISGQHVGIRFSRRHWGEKHLTEVSLVKLVRIGAPMMSADERQELRSILE